MTTSSPVYRRPWLYDKQRAALFNDARYAIVEASTKSGKTTACMVWLTEQALAGTAGRNYWWVAPIFPQAKIAFRRLKRGLPPTVYTANESELTLTLTNGATLWFKGADKPDSLYGEDVYAAVIDEASRCKEEAWYAVRSTLTATRGPLRIIGNVKGRRNWAYQLARRAEAGEPAMHYAKLTAYDAVQAGVLDAAEIEDARRQLPESVFRELYLAEPSDDGGNPFGLSAIAACIGAISSAVPITWGWDLAKSVDWTVGIALDAAGAVCRFQRFQKPWQDTIGTIRRETNGCQALVDSTGVGDPVLEALQHGSRTFEGFKFTAPSKQQLMEGLAVAIQQHEIAFPAGPIVAELEAFEYQYTRTGVQYAAPAGMHDDCVCALALAVSHRRPPRWAISASFPSRRHAMPASAPADLLPINDSTSPLRTLHDHDGSLQITAQGAAGPLGPAVPSLPIAPFPLSHHRHERPIGAPISDPLFDPLQPHPSRHLTDGGPIPDIHHADYPHRDPEQRGIAHELEQTLHQQGLTLHNLTATLGFSPLDELISSITA